MKRLLPLIVAMALLGCVTPPSRKALIINEADEATIKDCQYCGEVYGTDQWGYQLTRNAKIEYSKNMAKEQAYNLGATHIVWTRINTGLIPSATGRAYKCND